MIRRILIALALTSTCIGAAAEFEPEPEPVNWFTYAHPDDDILLNEGILCPGCETTEQFRNAARTACFEGYREADWHILDVFYYTSDLDRRPGVVRGSNGRYHVAGENDPCRYSMEIRGNLRGTGKVHVRVCNFTECRIVTNQFVPECPGIGFRISNGMLSVNIVADCVLVATGLEGLCTTVVDADLNEDQNCINTITDRGSIIADLPDIPGYEPVTTDPELPFGEPHPLGGTHGSPLHNILNHVLDCMYDGGFGQ